MSHSLGDNEIMELITNRDINFDDIQESHLQDAYDFVVNKLHNKGFISQPEYKFLCWLCHNNTNKYPSPVNEPKIPQILDISLEEFSNTFCFNEQRAELLLKLKGYLKLKNEIFNCPHIDLLFGGSFLDLNNSCPSDIDCAILLNREIIQTYPYACDNYYKHFQGEEIDANFLYEDYSFKQYRVFIWLTMLGNLPAIKDKENTYEITNNSFQLRPVYRVRFEFETGN